MRTAVLLAIGFLLPASAFAQTWSGPRPYNFFEATCRVGEAWCLTTVSIAHQKTANPKGGPQALEGYTIVEHTSGDVRLAMGVIGNIHLKGDGRLIEARPLQSGGVISGDGAIQYWTGLTIDRPKEQTPGQLREYRAIQFDNGFYITTEKDRDGRDTLVICAPDRHCTVFR